MAGDWIKMRNDLQTHPKVVRMSSALNADRFRTIGGLHAVWCLFDVHSADGTLAGYTPAVIDELVGFQGISNAMASVEWLIVSEHSSALPEFSEHNGQSAKRRAQEATRKRLDRAAEASALDADEKRTRGEERREEKKVPKGTNTPPIPDGVSTDVWTDFVAHRKTKKAPITKTALDGISREAVLAGWELEAALSECCARGWSGFKAAWVMDKGPTARATLNRQEALEARNHAIGQEWAAANMPQEGAHETQ